MPEDIEQCICGYEDELRKWTWLSISSCDGHSALLADIYDPKEDMRLNHGSVNLYDCPECGTVRFIPRR